MNMLLDTPAMGTAVTAVLSQLVTSIGELITTISTTPILAIGVGIFLAGGAIGLASRLIRV